jgi:hypothetical protein
MEANGQLYATAALLPGKESFGTLWIEGWVDPIASLDAMDKRKILLLPGIKPKPFNQ